MADPDPIKIDTSRRVAPLDGLRALAALAVVAFHLGIGLAAGGAVGVDWFFVLSGYLVTSVLLSQIERTGGVGYRTFYARRFRRLFLALFATVVTVLAVLAVLARDLLADAAREGASALLYISNVTDLGAGGPPEFFLHTWTLSLEMQFYLVLPLLLVGITRLGWTAGRQVVACVVLAVVLAGSRAVGENAFDEVSAVTTWPIFDLDRFLFGIALAIVLRNPGFARVKAVLAATWPAAVALVLCLVDVYAGQHWPDGWYALHDLLVCPAIALVIGHIMVADSSLLSRVLGWRVLTAIGTISYSLYLWHFPIFELLRDGVLIDGFGALRNAIKLPLAFGVAWVSYLLFERPTMRRRHPRPLPSAALDETPGPG